MPEPGDINNAEGSAAESPQLRPTAAAAPGLRDNPKSERSLCQAEPPQQGFWGWRRLPRLPQLSHPMSSSPGQLQAVGAQLALQNCGVFLK